MSIEKGKLSKNFGEYLLFFNDASKIKEPKLELPSVCTKFKAFIKSWFYIHYDKLNNFSDS